MLHEFRPKRRTDSPSTHSDAGGLSTVMKLDGVAGAEEQRLPALRAGLDGRRVEAVGPARTRRGPTGTARRSRASRAMAAGRTQVASGWVAVQPRRSSAHPAGTGTVRTERRVRWVAGRRAARPGGLEVGDGRRGQGHGATLDGGPAPGLGASCEVLWNPVPAERAQVLSETGASGPARCRCRLRCPRGRRGSRTPGRDGRTRACRRRRGRRPPAPRRCRGPR